MLYKPKPIKLKPYIPLLDEDNNNYTYIGILLDNKEIYHSKSLDNEYNNEETKENNKNKENKYNKLKKNKTAFLYHKPIYYGLKGKALKYNNYFNTKKKVLYLRNRLKTIKLFQTIPTTNYIDINYKLYSIIQLNKNQFIIEDRLHKVRYRN